MPEFVQVPVKVSSRNYRELPATSGEIKKVNWDKKDRASNAIKTFFVLLAATFCAIFVPILHFVLVPTFFMAMFIVSMNKYGETARNLGGEAECPKCHKSFVIEKSKFQNRLTDTCNHCHDDLEILI